MFKKNVGTTDMIIRLLIFVVMAYIGFFDNPIVSSGTSQTIIKFVAFIPLLTAVFRFCPLYSAIGYSTACPTPESGK